MEFYEMGEAGLNTSIAIRGLLHPHLHSFRTFFLVGFYVQILAFLIFSDFLKAIPVHMGKKGMIM